MSYNAHCNAIQEKLRKPDIAKLPNSAVDKDRDVVRDHRVDNDRSSTTSSTSSSSAVSCSVELSIKDTPTAAPFQTCRDKMECANPNDSAIGKTHDAVRPVKDHQIDNEQSSTASSLSSAAESCSAKPAVKDVPTTPSAAVIPFQAYRDKMKSANITGLWRQDENVRYILSEDGPNGTVIGFMQYKEVLKSTITGDRKPGNTFKIVEKMQGSQQSFEYVVSLFPEENRIEMVKSDGSVGMIPMVPIILQQTGKDIPPDLAQELEHLKRIEN